jgi:hypothetical protein
VIQFTFLGYAFRPRMARSARGVIFTNLYALRGRDGRPQDCVLIVHR